MLRSLHWVGQTRGAARARIVVGCNWFDLIRTLVCCYRVWFFVIAGQRWSRGIENEKEIRFSQTEVASFVHYTVVSSASVSFASSRQTAATQGRPRKEIINKTKEWHAVAHGRDELAPGRRDSELEVVFDEPSLEGGEEHEIHDE